MYQKYKIRTVCSPNAHQFLSIKKVRSVNMDDLSETKPNLLEPNLRGFL